MGRRVRRGCVVAPAVPVSRGVAGRCVRCRSAHLGPAGRARAGRAKKAHTESASTTHRLDMYTGTNATRRLGACWYLL
eukprot:2011620-Prymnesium_polylepis.1